MTNTMSYPQGAALPPPVLTLSPSDVAVDATAADSVEVVIGDQAGNPLIVRTSVTVVDADTLTWSWDPTTEITRLEPGLYALVVRLHYGPRYREFSGFVEIVDTVDV